MSGLFFGFTDCTPELQGPQLVIPAAVAEPAVTISSDKSDKSDYTFIEQAVRRFRGWITVTAERFRRTVVRAFCARFRNVDRMTGVQILRKCVILRF